jgi:hypothetical protein
MARSIALLGFLSAACADLDFSRVHFIDNVGDNLLFRSNMPLITVNGTLEFAYANLTSYMKQRAASEGGVAFPSSFYLQILSFDNILEITDIQVEIDFFDANPTLGNITFWPLVGQLLPPSMVDNATEQYYIHNETALWGVDLLPTRLQAIHSLLETTPSLPLVILIHCEAGCDRTGEFSAAYYMKWLNMNVTAAWNLDVSDCGRDPEFMSKNAIQWYCLTYEYETGSDKAGNCVNW